MHRFFLPLFWKFVIAIVLAIVLFNTIHIYFIRSSVNKSLQHELLLRGLFIARSIAERSLPLIVYSESVELNKLADETKKIDSSIAYVLILNGKSEVLAHSFYSGIPAGLIKTGGEVIRNYHSILIEASDEKGKYIRDIAVPVLDSKIGIVRVGLYEDMIRSNAEDTFRFLIILVQIFLIIGLALAFMLSYIITAPVTFISKAAESVNLGSLGQIQHLKANFENNFFFKLRRLFFSYDEIDILYRKFTGMVERIEKANNELQSVNESLNRSEKMASIGILASGIAHEINNPLSGIQNCIRRIGNQPGNIEQSVKYLNLMDEAVGKIETVVGGILNFSSKQELRLAEIDLNIPLENALMLCAFHLERNRIAITKNIPYDLPTVAGSRNHLEQVFVNLIINSSDAIVEKNKTGNGFTSEIRFDCKYDEHQVWLDIHDTGIGIQEKHIKNIFDPFYTTKQPGQGTGLGLSISYNIIKEHHGDISVKSDYGIGTTVTLAFPRILKPEPVLC